MNLTIKFPHEFSPIKLGNIQYSLYFLRGKSEIEFPPTIDMQSSDRHAKSYLDKRHTPFDFAECHVAENGSKTSRISQFCICRVPFLTTSAICRVPHVPEYVLVQVCA